MSRKYSEQDIKVIYEVRAGSRAYGTAQPESDEDFRGVGVYPLDRYFGCLKIEDEKPDQNEEDAPDRVLYDVVKFCRMVLECNPNIIELLYTEEPDIITVTPSGKKLRDHRDAFLSRKVRSSFLGFAYSQIKRIKTHRNWLLHPIERKPERKDFGLPEHKTIPLDQQEAFIWMCSRIIANTREELKLKQETLEDLRDVNFHGCLQSEIPAEILPMLQTMTGASDNFIYAMKQERAYANSLAEWRSYQHWVKTRNPKRAALEKKCGYDSKHAYHAVRICREGLEILKGEGVKVRRPDAEELVYIRNGNWSFEQVEAYMDEMAKSFELVVVDSPLPLEPNYELMTQLCQEILCNELYTDIVVNLI